MFNQGVNKIDYIVIDNFLSNYSKQYAVFNLNKGCDYCYEAEQASELENFEYNFRRLKKFSLLRYYEKCGLDTRFIYNPSVVDPTEQEKEEIKFDAYTIDSIIDLVENFFVSSAKLKFANDSEVTEELAGKGMRELKEKLKEEPEIGIPMQSGFMNTILRGARIGKLYLRSGNTGSGKTRTGTGDICNYSIPWYYDTDKKKWIHTGFSCPSLLITTEVEHPDVKTMIMAYVSGVDESHICDGKYAGGDKDEEARVDQAITYIESSPLYVAYMEDFNIQDLTHIIKKYKREYGVQYIMFDYIQETVKIMTEISGAARGIKLRGDQVLLMMTAQLKSLCNKLNVHMDSFTQVNGNYENVKEKNQNILAGGKAIANKIDAGIIALAPSAAELEAVRKNVLSTGFYKEPNLIYHVYKVRKGKLNRVMVWLYSDLGTCRTEDLFVTDLDCKLIPVEKLTIENIDEVLSENEVGINEIYATPEEQEEAVRNLIF